MTSLQVADVLSSRSGVAYRSQFELSSCSSSFREMRMTDNGAGIA